MSQKEPDNGPKFVWNFPLMRRLQTRNRFLPLLTSMMQDSVDNSGNTPTSPDKDMSSAVSEPELNDLDDIENTIGDLDDESESVFNPEPDTIEVKITDDGFVPEEVLINEDDTVKWVNSTSETRKVVSMNNGEFSSDTIDPNDTYEHTFRRELLVQYRDPTSSLEEGSIVVGDTDMDMDVTRLDNSNESGDGVRSMSQAASEKENIDAGFE